MNDVAKVLLGIDFGTSTTVMCLQEYANDGCPIGDVQCLEEIPSIVYKDLEGNCYFGEDAEKRYLNQRTGTLCRNFKIGLASDDCDKSKELVAEFFKHLFDKSKTRMGFYVGKCQIQTLISVPVKWSAVVKEFMRHVAYEAGFGFELGEDKIKVVNEPNAATYAVILPRIKDLRAKGVLEPTGMSNVMMIDMGAGTTDITIFKLKFNDGCPEIDDNSVHTYPNSRSPVLCGGREIDETLSKYYREKFHSTKPIDVICYRMKTWKETELSKIVRENSEAFYDTFVYGGGEMSLSRSQFLDLTKEHWCQWHEIVNGALDDAGVRAEDIDLIMLTGGHSKWKPFLEEYFIGIGFCNLVPRNYLKIKNQPNERILADKNNPSQTVANGLVLSECSLVFPNVAEADYWIEFEIDGDADGRRRIELCKKGSMLPIEEVQGEVVCGIESHLLRMKSIPALLSVFRGETDWSEKLLERKVFVPVTDKICRPIGAIGASIFLAGIDTFVGFKDMIMGQPQTKSITWAVLTGKYPYTFTVKIVFRINELGTASGNFLFLDADGNDVRRISFEG